jgi:tetratricopeptide (TPR) repeat protein
MTLRSALKPVALLVIFVALGVYAWLSIQVYRAEKDPENFQAWDGPYAWIVGPRPKALNRVAERHLEDALAVLRDETRPESERLRVYRDHLERADKLYVRSLRAQPAQADALSTLAAVRWELSPPRTEQETRRLLDMIALASKMAPQNAGVHLSIGKVLFGMGRREEAYAALRRCVEIDGSQTAPVVKFLRENLVPAEEILERLPAVPGVLVVLRDPFFEDGLGERYLELGEKALASPTAEMLRAYGDACVRSRQFDRLRATMDRVGKLSDPRLEAWRLAQRARGLAGWGDGPGAIADARAASALQPEDGTFVVNLGQVALTARDGETAAKAFRDALALAAKGGWGASSRANLHANVGMAEELRGRPDRAFDAYRTAVSLDPNQPHASRRLREMKSAAGRKAS